MDKEARLLRALGAPAAPKRDARFVLAVMRDAETARFKKASVLAVLRGAGFAAAAAALAVPFLGSTSAGGAALQSGAVGAGALLTLVLALRVMTGRAAAVRR